MEKPPNQTNIWASNLSWMRGHLSTHRELAHSLKMLFRVIWHLRWHPVHIPEMKTCCSGQQMPPNYGLRAQNVSKDRHPGDIARVCTVTSWPSGSLGCPAVLTCQGHINTQQSHSWWWPLMWPLCFFESKSWWTNHGLCELCDYIIAWEDTKNVSIYCYFDRRGLVFVCALRVCVFFSYKGHMLS